MRFGLALPQYGTFAEPRMTVEVARAGEALGYDSLWVGDRILVPEHARDRYPGGDGTIPPMYRAFLDPLVLLTAAAGVTERVRLGTSTLNALWTPPILLARSLATLDRFSAGRLDVGIGLGWSSDEYQAVGVPWTGRGARLEETLDVLETVWGGTGPVEHTGPHWTVPRSAIEAKPEQRPRPPLLFGGFAPAALERVGRRGDGWLGTGLPVPRLVGIRDTLAGHAVAAGRDPEALRLVVRLNPVFTDAPAAAGLVPRTGTVEQFTDYVRAAAAVGVDELLIDLQHTTTTVDELLRHAELLITALGDLR
jgi:probable F420-dependent oxidoreductase